MNNKKLEKIFTKHNIVRVIADFDMGGDSGEVYDIEAFDINEQLIPLNDYEVGHIRDSIYTNVEFYEISDGHYNGEYGSVTIEYEKEEGEFLFNKEGKAKYTELERNIIFIKFSEDEINYIKEYLSDFGQSGWNGYIFIYKKDFIFTEKHQEIEYSIRDKIILFLDSYDYKEEADGQEEVTIRLHEGPQSYKLNKVKFNMEYYYTKEEELE